MIDLCILVCLQLFSYKLKKAIELLLFPVVVLCWQGQFYLPSAEIMEAFSYLCPPRRPLEILMSPEYLQFSLYEL